MAVKVQQVLEILEQIAPPELACSWDNVGLLVDAGRPVTSIMTALDITADVVRDAAESGCELIVSHHPVIFDPLRRVTAEDVPAMLLQNGISAICMHTNLDAAPGGVNDVLADLLRIENRRDFADNCGRIGTLNVPTTAQQLAETCSRMLHTHCKFVEADHPVEKLAEVSGAGGSYLQQAIDEGITVVNFDIAIEADGVYRVSGDNYDMGYQSAQYIVDKIGTEGTVVVLDVPTSGSVAELRKKGFTETMAAEAPNMVLKEYATEFTREAGLADMADILTANSQIDAVFSMDDETSIGALQAIRDAGRTDIKVITGGGGCQEWFNMMLADENQDIWLQSALYSPDMVEDAVDMALDILNGNAPEDPVKIIPTTILDRDTVESHLDENSPY